MEPGLLRSGTVGEKTPSCGRLSISIISHMPLDAYYAMISETEGIGKTTACPMPMYVLGSFQDELLGEITEFLVPGRQDASCNGLVILSTMAFSLSLCIF